MKSPDTSKYNIPHTVIHRAHNKQGKITVLYMLKDAGNELYSIATRCSYTDGVFITKKPFEPSATYTTITDEKTVEFLQQYSAISDQSHNYPEAIQLLKNLFPDKQIRNFTDLTYIVDRYMGGEEPIDIVYSSLKDDTYRFISNMPQYYEIQSDPRIKEANDKLQQMDNNNEYDDCMHLSLTDALVRDVIYEKYNLTDAFKHIGKAAVVYPVIFSYYLSRYDYIMFVVTDTAVYFEASRPQNT